MNRFMEKLRGGRRPRLEGVGRVKPVSCWAQASGRGPSPADRDYQRRPGWGGAGGGQVLVWATLFFSLRAGPVLHSML